jgi:hypothetical protein
MENEASNDDTRNAQRIVLGNPEINNHFEELHVPAVGR